MEIPDDLRGKSLNQWYSWFARNQYRYKSCNAMAALDPVAWAKMKAQVKPVFQSINGKKPKETK